jgi:hypothetical protein
MGFVSAGRVECVQDNGAVWSARVTLLPGSHFGKGKKGVVGADSAGFSDTSPVRMGGNFWDRVEVKASDHGECILCLSG